MLARTENVVQYRPGTAQLTMLGRIPMYVADAMGRAVFLYKEKINCNVLELPLVQEDISAHYKSGR